jgi:hypothetical membrane protein
MNPRAARSGGTLTPTVVALRMGIAVPLVYFGVQLAAAPFYPGYSFLARDASTLGSPGSSLPGIFNAGVLIAGVLAIVGSAGYFSALRQLRARTLLAWLTAAAVACGGLGAVNAGLFPLPDPRHTDGLLAQIGMGLFPLPILLPAAIWRLPHADAMRRYLVANALVLAAFVPVISGLVQRAAMAAGVDLPAYQYFLDNCQGLLQRLAAATVFVPIGVVAWFLAREIKRQGDRQ